MPATCAATVSARPWFSPGASACSTLATPAICAAACAAAAAPVPATSRCTSGLQANAAVTVFSVAPRTVLLSCSAITNAAISDHLRFVLQLGHQGGDIGHLDTGAALGRLGDLQGLDARRHVNAQVGG